MASEKGDHISLFLIAIQILDQTSDVFILDMTIKQKYLFRICNFWAFCDTWHLNMGPFKYWTLNCLVFVCFKISGVLYSHPPCLFQSAFLIHICYKKIPRWTPKHSQAWRTLQIISNSRNWPSGSTWWTVWLSRRERNYQQDHQECLDQGML